MTKQVRIEDADTSNNPVLVQVWQVNPNAESTLVDEVKLNGPTDLRSFLIHKQQYLVVKEA